MNEETLKKRKQNSKIFAILNLDNLLTIMTIEEQKLNNAEAKNSMKKREKIINFIQFLNKEVK
jgi:hypothetical protein